jgi:hypothetical protein
MAFVFDMPRHVTVYSGVLASNSKWRRLIIPKARCPDCGGKLKLIALVKTEESIRKILTAMHLPTGPLQRLLGPQQNSLVLPHQIKNSSGSHGKPY